MSALASFTFRATDKGDSVVDPASAKLYINGNEVALTAGDKVLDATDFGFVGDKFEPNTEINYVIEISDSNINGNEVALTAGDKGWYPDHRFRNHLFPELRIAQSPHAGHQCGYQQTRLRLSRLAE